jgi:hypothetical protein
MMGKLGTERRLLVVAVLAAVAALAAGVAQSRAGTAVRDRQFVLVETTTDRATVDVDRSGTSTPGDAFLFHSVLTTPGGTAVGTVDGHCIVLMGARNLCHSVVSLPRGTLATTFVAPAGAATLEITIDGGTRRFDRARGQILATRATSTAFREVFDVDR